MAAKRGRPTEYKPAYAKEAHELCLLGYTQEELGEHFGVRPETICVWKRKFPKFSKAIKDGGKVADAKVAQALFRRATGYSHAAVKVFSFEGQAFEHKITEHYPPDFQSMRLWLMNRQPQKWRDRQTADTGDDRLDEVLDLMQNGPATNEEPADPGAKT